MVRVVGCPPRQVAAVLAIPAEQTLAEPAASCWKGVSSGGWMGARRRSGVEARAREGRAGSVSRSLAYQQAGGARMPDAEVMVTTLTAGAASRLRSGPCALAGRDAWRGRRHDHGLARVAREGGTPRAPVGAFHCQPGAKRHAARPRGVGGCRACASGRSPSARVRGCGQWPPHRAGPSPAVVSGRYGRPVRRGVTVHRPPLRARRARLRRRSSSTSSWRPSVLYGGVTEELLLRSGNNDGAGLAVVADPAAAAGRRSCRLRLACHHGERAGVRRRPPAGGCGAGRRPGWTSSRS